MKKIILLIVFLGLLGAFFLLTTQSLSGRMTTYTLGDNLLVESFDFATREGIRITFPGNFEIEATGGRGKWWVNKIKKAGDDTWITQSLVWHLGLGGLVSRDHLSLWDKFLIWKVKSKIIWKDLEIIKTGLVDVDETLDKAQIWVLNSRWYKNEFFQDSQIASEKLSVSVANTTAADGLGAKASRIIELAGMRTTMLETTNSNISEACVLTTSKENQKKLGVKFLVLVFTCSLKIDDSLKDDVRLELGQKLALWLFG